MNVAVESYKNLGILALTIFWFTTAVMVILLKGDKARSISSHAASGKKVALIFGVVATIATALLVLFFVKWFTPTFNLGPLFNVLVVSMAILYGVAAVVPDTKGIKHKVHVWAAVIASVLLMPVMVMIIASDQVSQSAQIFTSLALLTMIFIGYKLLRTNRKNDKLLIYEALYFLCFDVSVLVVTYVR